MRLKQKIKKDQSYMVNLREIQQVRHDKVEENYKNSIVVNRIAAGDARDQKENLDPDFGAVWKQCLHGGQIPSTLNPNQWIKAYESGVPSEVSDRDTYINVE